MSVPSGFYTAILPALLAVAVGIISLIPHAQAQSLLGSPTSASVPDLLQSGRRDEALANANEMVSRAKRSGNPREQANALHVLGDVYRSRGQYQDAAQTYEAAMLLREKAFGADSVEVAATLDAMVHNFEAAEDLAAARRAAERSYAIRTKKHLEDGCSIVRTPRPGEPASDCDLAGTVLNTKLTEQVFKEPLEAVPVYFGTDRKRQDVKLPNGTRVGYGPERGGELRFGVATITVPRNHASAQVERPWALTLLGVKFYSQGENPNRHFVVGEISEMSEAGFIEQARKRMGDGQRFNGQAFVFVHGYNMTFDDAMFRTAQIAYDLKFDGAPFLFSWPSKGSAVNYNLDTNSARQSEFFFEQFLNAVMERSGAKQVHVVAHSMGNQLLLAALDKISRTGRRSTIAEVVLAAPDVDRDVFRNAVKQISKSVRGLTLYVSNADRAMHASRVWNGAPRAGDHPPNGPLVTTGLDTIDTSAISNDVLSLNHSTYGSSLWLINDIASLMLSGKRPPGDRTPILRSIPSANGNFWKFPPM